MAEAALSRFQTLRGAMRWPKVKPAASAAAVPSKTFTSYLAARSFGCIPVLFAPSPGGLLVFLRQRVAPVAEDFADAALVGRLQDFQPVGAALLKLLALHVRELRQRVAPVAEDFADAAL